MRLNVTALSIASGVFGAPAFWSLQQPTWPGPVYGQAFLQLCASIYPGYHPGSGAGSVVTGTIYALVDGAVGGAIFGWLYNLFVARMAE